MIEQIKQFFQSMVGSDMDQKTPDTSGHILERSRVQTPPATNADVTETVSPAPGAVPPVSQIAPPASQIAPPPAETLEELPTLREAVVRVLKTVYDPEIPVNIYELGLIYSIEIKEESFVQIRMTLTAPGCPVADILPAEVEAKVRAVPGVRDVELELVWEPAWNMTMMSEAARLTLGMF